MNNITPFPADTQYPAIDAALLRKAAKDAADASLEVQNFFIKTNYLSPLHARVKEGDGAIRDAEFKLRETVQALNLNIAAHVKTLRVYQTELVTATASDKQEILEDITTTVSTVLNTVSKHQNALDRLHVAMSSAVDRADTGGYLTQFLADKENLTAEVLDIRARQNALQAKLETLTQAMGVIESKGFATIGKETALNAQNIATLATAGPEVAVLNTAIELAQQTLENVESFINYIGLMNARDAIRKQIDELLNRIERKTVEQRTVEMKAKLIQASHEFEDHRVQYTTEFAKVIAAAKSFVGAYQNVDPADQNAVAQFAADALGLANYMKASA